MARTEREERSTEESGHEPREKKTGVLLKWGIIGLTVLLIAGVIAGGASYYWSSSTGAAKKKTAAQPVIGTIWPMEPFIINLQDAGGDRYWKLVVQLEILCCLHSVVLDQYFLQEL